jgi:hypothetical protein
MTLCLSLHLTIALFKSATSYTVFMASYRLGRQPHLDIA